MHLQEQSSEGRWSSWIAGSVCISALVLFWDVGNEGFYTFSLIICPPWFLISVIKNAIQRPGWRTAIPRVSVPLLTFAIAFGNGNLQWRISDAHAQQVIKACEEFRLAKGRYPSKLDELVPKYLSSIPPAKYCMFLSDFFYVNNGEDQPMLWWTRYGFYRRFYNFHERRWSNLD
jgi:hypothetical protein